MEFQAVLLAGSQGTLLAPLCEVNPPCLLPIATRPLLHFQLDFIAKSGFTECILVTRTAYVRGVTHCIDVWRSGRGGGPPPIIERVGSHGPVVVSNNTNTAKAGDTREEAIINTTDLSSPSSSTTSASTAAFSLLTIHLEHIDVWEGTCAALRHIKHLLHSDFFCFQADLITNIQLHHLADVHRSRDAALTVLLLDTSLTAAQEAALAASTSKKKKDSEQEDLDTHYIGLINEPFPNADSPTSNERLLFYKSTVEVDDETLNIHKSLLRRSPTQTLTLHTELKDPHLYLFALWVLEVIEEKRDIISLQKDLVPYLIKSQFNTAFKRYQQEQGPLQRADSLAAFTSVASTLSPQTTASTATATNRALALSMSHSAPIIAAEESYRCYVYTAKPSNTLYCKRANSLKHYRSMNMELSEDKISLTSEGEEPPPWWIPLAADNYVTTLSKQHPRCGLASSFLSASVFFPPDGVVSVKRSIVGRNTHIGAGAKIQSSVIMDNVMIEDHVVMMECIISDGCIIGKSSQSYNCELAPNFQLEENSKVKNEKLQTEREA